MDYKFTVTDIVVVSGFYQFDVWCTYADGHTQKLSTHRNEIYKGLQLFRYHHENMKAIYEGASS